MECSQIDGSQHQKTLHDEKWEKIFIYTERDGIFFSNTFSEVIPIGGKNKNTEIYEQCCLFIIQELSSYHMLGKFTERQSERKLPA